MKRFLLLFLSLISLALISCSSVFEANVKHGSLCVTMPGGNERIAFSNDLFWYEVNLEGPVSKTETAYPGETIVFREIPEGHYAVKVEGYTEKQDSNGNKVNARIYYGVKEADVAGEGNVVPVVITFEKSVDEKIVQLVKVLEGSIPEVKEFDSLTDAFEYISTEAMETAVQKYNIRVNGNIVVESAIVNSKNSLVNIDFGNNTVFVKDFEKDGERAAVFKVDTEGSSLALRNGLLICEDKVFNQSLFRGGTNLALDNIKISGFKGNAAMAYVGGGYIYTSNCKFYNCNVVNGSDGLIHAYNANISFMKTVLENCGSAGNCTLFCERSGVNQWIPKTCLNGVQILQNKDYGFAAVCVKGSSEEEIADGTYNHCNCFVYNCEFLTKGKTIEALDNGIITESESPLEYNVWNFEEFKSCTYREIYSDVK